MAAPASVPLYPFQARLPAPVYWMFRAVRTVLVALCFAGFWSGAVAICWLWLPVLWLWPGPPADKIRRVHRSVRRGFGVFHFAMHALRLYHRRSPALSLRPGDSPVVLIANHPTLCDVTSIASLFPDVVAVASPRFAANPLLGRLVRGCGFVPTGCHMIRECEDRLRMGFDVLVFPEGTRSPAGGSLHPFHRGAFELATRAKVPIVLLKLTCVPRALSKKLPIWKVADHMAVLTIEPFDVIHPAEYGPESRALCRAIERRYRDLFGYAAPAGHAVPAAPASEPSTSRRPPVTTTPSNLHQELKLLIVETLQLEDVDPASISDTDALFGAGLELDSIDALELATAIARKYDVEVNQDQETRDAFRSVSHLAEFITMKRAAAGAPASRAG